jgi:hypothetical protein
MELAKHFDKKSKQLDRLPKRDLNRPGLTFGALLEQHFPIPAPTSLKASAVPPKPPQLVLHMLWNNDDQDPGQYAEPIYPSDTEELKVVLWDSDPEDPEVVPASDSEVDSLESRVSRRSPSPQVSRRSPDPSGSRRSPAPSRRRLPAPSGCPSQADQTVLQPEAVTPAIPSAIELEASGPSISASGRRSSSVLSTPPASPGKARNLKVS